MSHHLGSRRSHHMYSVKEKAAAVVVMAEAVEKPGVADKKEMEQSILW